ncbi:DUF6304 family protein [Streptomyces lomondensis]|uniref:Uncharacterized protein n=1 Tax=Streptomyces lomondensis TaxID=68229 RepID=A0ABQ2XRI1_9ACTN|nr:DUF6304 family protein [Streptomyces lomondensis]MCF0080856.1 DUF6304 family protein [Streptomyces lomondensis]GGX30807.1 hypothetical protein GCM10010383_71420 [Streptomyces lomondensis]
MTGLQHWPGRYTDRHGSQEVVFESDGRELIRTTIRGVLFEGDSMDTLGAQAGEPPAAMFRLHDGDLRSCLLQWRLPLSVEFAGQGVREGMLHCALRLPDPAAPDGQSLVLTLRLDGREYGSPDDCGDFEEGLYAIQRELPPGARLKACIACAWSDYNPVGHGLMAGLACFRDAKDRYRQVDGKQGPRGIFAIWKAHTELVQETWLCGRFEPRATHTGYRGSFP